MKDTHMPATEATIADAHDDERGSYELAFHILPTVAEGEVPTVFAALKDIITHTNAEVFDEETPERLDLAYEVVEHLEGKNRRFASAYFGWVRFRAEGASIETITNEIDTRTDILRYMVIRLTKVEEENPFRFHEALRDEKMVTHVEESDVVPDTTATATDQSTSEPKAQTTTEETGEKRGIVCTQKWVRVYYTLYLNSNLSTLCI